MKPQVLLVLLLGLVLLLRLQGVPLEGWQASETENKLTPVRRQLAVNINRLLPEPQGALLSGILLGVKSDLPKHFKEALVNTSTIHIAVVSGQNLSLLAGFILNLAGLIGRRKAIILSWLACLFYTFLTGLEIPVLRAFIMVSFTFLAQILGRENESVWILILTALLMLIFQPLWITSISFQLSFLATLAVVAVAPRVIERLKFVPEIIREDFGVSFSAQLLTFPIIALNFHNLSLIGLLVNTLVLWTITPIMILGVVSLSLSFLFGNVVMLLPGVFLTYFVYIVNFFAQVPLASIYIPSMPIIVWVGYYLLLSGIIMMLRKS